MRARAGILAAVLCAAAGSCNGQSPPLDPLACADRVHCSWEGASARYVCVYAANTTALGPSTNATNDLVFVLCSLDKRACPQTAAGESLCDPAVPATRHADVAAQYDATDPFLEEELAAAGFDVSSEGSVELFAAHSVSSYFSNVLEQNQCTAMCVGYGGYSAFKDQCMFDPPESESGTDDAAQCPYRGCRSTLTALTGVLDGLCSSV